MNIRIWIAAFSTSLALLAQPEADLSPAQRRIAQAEQARRQYPRWAPAAAALAAAYVQRTRETGDPAYLVQAEAAVAESLKFEADHPSALKARVQILLEQHRDQQAGELAAALRKRAPDDLETASLLSQATFATGEYDLAERSAQFIRDLRPAERLGYLRGAELREVYGDVSGALDYWREGLVRTPVDETYDQAYIYTRQGRLLARTGSEAAAEQALRRALQIAPGYYQARIELAKLQLSQEHAPAAVETLRNNLETCAACRYWQAVAVSRAGGQPDWSGILPLLRQQAPLLAARYYLEINPQPAEALRLLQIEAKQRQNVDTLHLLAWALLATGNPAQAEAMIGKALRIGVRDAELFAHAGQIAAARGDQATAERYLQQAASLDRHFGITQPIPAKRGSI